MPQQANQMIEMGDAGWKAADWMMTGLGIVGSAIIGLAFRELATLRKCLLEGDEVLRKEIDALRESARADDTAVEHRVGEDIKQLRADTNALVAAIRQDHSDLRREISENYKAMIAAISEIQKAQTSHREFVYQQMHDFMPRSELKAELANLRSDRRSLAS